MAGYKGSTFTDRQLASAEARRAVLEKFRARPGPEDPAVQQRIAEQLAAAETRAARAAERRRAKEAEAARAATIEAERQAELARQAALQRQRDAEAAAAALTRAAEQKAARDARYAARKARRR